MPGLPVHDLNAVLGGFGLGEAGPRAGIDSYRDSPRLLDPLTHRTALPMWQPPRALVVDDCADTRATLRALLGVWGYDVQEASDGHAALGLAATFLPDVVVLDIGLPDLDGYEVARRLRQVAGLGGVLLGAVSGCGGPDMAACRAAGIDHVLLKPLDPSKLEGLLRPRPE